LVKGDVGNPADAATDVGPLIDATAKARISAYIATAKTHGRLLKQIEAPETGHFVAPAVISVVGIGDLEEEIFGPVLHVATFENTQFDAVVGDINARGFGLTFGLHSRIDERVQRVIDRVRVGNIYINRNQIGAVVGSQPFGGEGLSGTGPKAGGPKYLQRFYRQELPDLRGASGPRVFLNEIEAAFAANATIPIPNPAHELPGPTGESNRYFTAPKGRVLCLGPGAEAAQVQVHRARQLGCNAVAVAPDCKDGLDGVVQAEHLTQLSALVAVICSSKSSGAYRKALAQREGPIVPLHCDNDYEKWLLVERHACIDTTAAGGNVSLLGG